MEILIRVLLLANLAFSMWLLWQYRRMRAELRAALARLEDAVPAGAVLARRERSPLISVAILNPMELAAKESQLARMFGGLTPELVRREVYKEIRRRLSVQLQEQGVVAEVMLHDGS